MHGISPIPDYPKALTDLAAGRMTSTILDVALDLKVFAKLQGKSVTLQEAGALWGLPSPSARVLAQHLCRMELLIYREGKLSNALIAETCLAGDRKSLMWLRRMCWFGISPKELKYQLLNPLPQEWYQIRDHDEGISDNFYDGWYHTRRILWGEELALIYDFSGHKTLLDVGGASGGWCIGLLKHYPHLRCIIFDMPHACNFAKQKIAEAGVADHIQAVSGSFFQHDLPNQADAVLLANILHDWSLNDGRKILRRVHHALPAGGVLLVKEFFFEDDFSGSVTAATEALSVLGPEGKSGWQPTYGEMETVLKEEGFVEFERRKDLLVAKKRA